MGTVKCIGILTSGGDAPGMNAAIRAVTRAAIYNGLQVKGIYRGYRGLVTGEIKEFKSQNITDLILDLRYNGGGHVISANLIATCIAGAKSEGKVFTSLRYNKERMEKRNNKREEELFAYSNYENLATSLSAGALNLQHVYCIVGSGTASASELVINSLKGIDVEVTLIGKRTTGKNVGMEPVEYTIRNNVYEVVPITFQIYNAKGVGDYENGFTPEIDENDPYGRGDGYYIYRDYGSDKEFLYARAIQEITGQAPVPTTRSAETLMRGKALKVPAIYRRGHEGMIKLPK